MFAMYNDVLVFNAGYRVGLKAFTAAILGGIGNVPGAVLGAMIIGLTEALTTLKFGSQWDDVTTFAMLMLVLLLRRAGCSANASPIRSNKRIIIEPCT